MKIIIIGTSLAGKTTLVKYLRSNTSLNIQEMDEQLTTLNGGSFPTDIHEKHNILAPQVIASILGESEIVFFTNTDYFSHTDLINAREAGFKIVQLSLRKEVLTRRNTQRVKDEGYNDMTEWLEGMLEYQSDIAAAGLVDQVIDADQPTAKLAQELLAEDFRL